MLARPRLAALPLVLALAAAPAARAAPTEPLVDSSVRGDGTTVVRYVAPPHEHNEVLLRVRAEALDPYKRQRGVLDDTGIDFYDIGADGIRAAGSLCRPQGTGVGCDVAGTRVEVQVLLGDGDDVITPESDRSRRVPVHIDAGPGEDALIAHGSNPTALDFRGGPGVDAVDYFDPRAHPFRFTDDGLPNDGLGADNVHRDVELYVGGDGNDSFAFASAGRHIVFGTAGNDTMVSGPGPDEFDGGYGGDPAGSDAPSNDTVTYAGRPAGVTVTLDGSNDDGAPGEGDQILPTVERVVGTDHDDTLVGPARVEDRRPYRLDGGDGNDDLSGGAGLDLIDAGAGDDVAVTLGGGKDAIRCGPGTDVAVADRSDLTKDCEYLWHSYVRAASRQTGEAVEFIVAVPAPGSTIEAKLLSGKGTVAGSGSAKLGAGLHALRLKLSKGGRQALRRAGSLALDLRVRISSPGRPAVSGSKRVMLARG